MPVILLLQAHYHWYLIKQIIQTIMQMMLSTMYSIEVIHYNITTGALQLFVYLYYYYYYYYDKSLNFY